MYLPNFLIYLTFNSRILYLLFNSLTFFLTDPDRKTIIRLSYSTLDTKSNQLARQIFQHLQASNRKEANKDGDHVITVCMEPSEKLIIALLAIWKVGAAYLPLDVNTPVNRIEHIFNEVKPLMMITDQESEKF